MICLKLLSVPPGSPSSAMGRVSVGSSSVLGVGGQTGSGCIVPALLVWARSARPQRSDSVTIRMDLRLAAGCMQVRTAGYVAQVVHCSMHSTDAQLAPRPDSACMTYMTGPPRTCMPVHLLTSLPWFICLQLHYRASDDVLNSVDHASIHARVHATGRRYRYLIRFTQVETCNARASAGISTGISGIL